MGLDAKHPQYEERLPDWERTQDCFDGERAVKDRGAKYLPFTASMIEDGAPNSGSKGTKAYEAYRIRARVSSKFPEAVAGLLGRLHSKPPTIELPESMEYLRERATLRRQSLEVVLQLINEGQLTTGRIGVIGDVISGSASQRDRDPSKFQPGELYLSLYDGVSIINWDSQTTGDTDDGTVGPDAGDLTLVVLDETHDVRGSDFSWESQTRYRVLILGDPGGDDSDAAEERISANSVYQQGVFQDADFSRSKLRVLSVNGRPSSQIPFIFVNATDSEPDPGMPPLLGVADLVISM